MSYCTKHRVRFNELENTCPGCDTDRDRAEAGSIPQPPKLIAFLHRHRTHTLRDGSVRPLCGKPIGNTQEIMFSDGDNDCKTCEKSAKKAERLKQAAKSREGGESGLQSSHTSGNGAL